jgi:peptide/nickel transport system ATP-binding protein
MLSESTGAVLSVSNLAVTYRGRRLLPWSKGGVKAVRNVSFVIERGETLALVGESGSGKSTVAQAIAGLLPRMRGTVRFGETVAPRAVRRRPRDLKRKIQLVFQNPDGSLNPRHRVETILARPLVLLRGLDRYRVHKVAMELLRDVELDPGYLNRVPRQLSGGERQRVAIARALAAEPDLILCDEVLTALDVSVQASILALLRSLQDRHGVAYLFISHDLAVVRWIAHRVAVMYAGEICEIGQTAAVFAPPYHPYTELLLAAVPRLFATQRADIGGAPVVRATPRSDSGCPFASRCPRRIGQICFDVRPPRQSAGGGHEITCHIPIEHLIRLQAGGGS